MAWDGIGGMVLHRMAGLAWDGMELHRTASNGIKWHRMAWDGMVMHQMALDGTE